MCHGYSVLTKVDADGWLCSIVCRILSNLNADWLSDGDCFDFLVLDEVDGVVAGRLKCSREEKTFLPSSGK
ncbi:unnamed protein product [Calypogeia fissa]